MGLLCRIDLSIFLWKRFKGSLKAPRDPSAARGDLGPLCSLLAGKVPRPRLSGKGVWLWFSVPAGNP
jgi:hypothetical protein